LTSSAPDFFLTSKTLYFKIWLFLIWILTIWTSFSPHCLNTKINIRIYYVKVWNFYFHSRAHRHANFSKNLTFESYYIVILFTRTIKQKLPGSLQFLIVLISKNWFFTNESLSFWGRNKKLMKLKSFLTVIVFSRSLK
jgi:hypothetical protein